MIDFNKEYQTWLNYKNLDEDLRKELESIRGDENQIADRFYKNLAFGTGGLRGKLGAGINRMNIYTVSRVTKALSRVISDYGNEVMKRGVSISHDCRIMSREFAVLCARIFATYGVKAYLFESLRPTPELSFAVRYLNCISGINITASHNPKEYNGYKVYWEEGAQIKGHIADKIISEMVEIDIFENTKIIDFDEALDKDLIKIIGEEVDEAYYKEVLSVSLSDDIDKEIKIVYTPLNGTGNIPVRTILNRKGFNNVYVVKEQEKPDGNFPTLKYPNPEDQRAFEYSQKLAEKVDADLLIATDPDADRLAVQLRKNGIIYGFNGNQIGVLLINYILERMKEKNSIPKNAAMVKTIVTGNLGVEIAKDYGVKFFNTLTGFKNIAEFQNKWDKTKEYRFIFGYEESIGYNAGNFVRDKDSVSSALLLAEAAAYYKKRKTDLYEVLENIFKKYGYYSEDTVSIILEGIEGQEKISRIMEQIRDIYPKNIGESKIVKTIDYNSLIETDIVSNKTSTVEMDKTNAFECVYDDKTWFALRPSGTEPKIKLYIYTKSNDKKSADNKIKIVEDTVKKLIDKVE